MHFEITHRTTYRYSVPVALGQHRLRVLPPDTHTQRVGHFALTVTPQPTTVRLGHDGWGNPTHEVEFEGSTELLEIHVHLVVETQAPPRERTHRLALPPPYPPVGVDLTPYLVGVEDSAELRDFVASVLAADGGGRDGFLATLNARIHGFYHRGLRLAGPPRGPAETIRRGDGVCRDLAVLFVAACRQVGIAARFASGYQQGDRTRAVRYLHAWPEVFSSDVGWVGYDPTHGCEVGDGHVRVAAAGIPEAATPVEGSYRFDGERLTSTLETDIRISTS
jgi:transglutaminase-like putative cysteine protease